MTDAEFEAFLREQYQQAYQHELMFGYMPPVEDLPELYAVRGQEEP